MILEIDPNRGSSKLLYEEGELIHITDGKKEITLTAVKKHNGCDGCYFKECCHTSFPITLVRHCENIIFQELK